MMHTRTVALGTRELAELKALPIEARREVRRLRLYLRAGGLVEGLADVALVDLPGLRAITLIREYLGGARVKALALLPASVTELELDGCTLDEPAMSILATMPVLAQLRRLMIVHGDLNAAKLGLLLRSPHLRGLEFLGLFNNALGAAGASLLAQAEELAGLRELDVTRTELGVDGFNKLLAGAWPGLVRINLNDNRIGDAGVGALARSEIFNRRLEGVDLAANGVGPAGVAALATARPELLTELVLFANGLIGDGIAALAEAAWKLTRLEMRLIGIGDAGAVALANGPLLASVVDLNVESNRIDELGAVALADSPRLAQLRRLVIRDNPLGVRGAAALRGSRWPVVREAARHVMPEITAPWPSTPRRRRKAAATAAVAGAVDPAVALARILAEGMVAEEPRRRFRVAKIEVCRSCHGHPIDGAGDTCQWCVGGREVTGWTDQTVPGTVDDAIAFAAETSVVAEVEANAWELVARLAAFAGAENTVKMVVWYFPPRAHWNGTSRWCFDDVVAALTKELDEPVGPGRGTGWPLWTAHCWQVAAGRDPDGSFAKCLDPFAPYLEILARGYVVEVEDAAVVIVARRAAQ